MRILEIEMTLIFLNKFQYLQAHLKTTNGESKKKHFSRISYKLLDSKTIVNSYWSILNTFLDNKRIPCTSPLLHSDKFIMDFKGKTELFNYFFERQCFLVHNSSELPSVLT